jgi:hypothetical protein
MEVPPVVLQYLQKRMCNKTAALVKASHALHTHMFGQAWPAAMYGRGELRRDTLTDFIAALLDDTMSFKTSSLAKDVFSRFVQAQHKKLWPAMDEIKPREIRAFYEELVGSMAAEKASRKDRWSSRVSAHPSTSRCSCVSS